LDTKRSWAGMEVWMLRYNRKESRWFLCSSIEIFDPLALMGWLAKDEVRRQAGTV